jgi:predicted transposase/invertase (TIGR01784 family)
MKFISPKTDFAFKKIFGSSDSKDILISFLNALIYDEQPTIKDLEIIDPYNSRPIVDLKDSYLDVKAVLKNGTTVIIEMQLLYVGAFEKRVVYNLAKTYGNQLESGARYSQLKPVIALTITDFIMFKNSPKVISKFSFKEDQDLFDYPHQEMKMVFVELPKFNKTLEEIDHLAEKWIYFLKETPNLQVIPPKMAEVPELDKALNIANRANVSLTELEEMQKREMWIEDRRGEITFAKEQGLAEGLAQGISQGISQGVAQGQMGIILRQLERRFEEVPESAIAKIQELSVDQLAELAIAILDLDNLEDLSQWLQQKLGS